MLTVAVRSIRLNLTYRAVSAFRFILPVGPVRHRCGLARAIKPRGPHRGGSFRPPKVQQRCGETMARTTKVPLRWSHVLTLVDLTRPRPLYLGHVNFRSPPCWGSVAAAFCTGIKPIIERSAETVLGLAPSQKRLSEVLALRSCVAACRTGGGTWKGVHGSFPAARGRSWNKR